MVKLFWRLVEIQHLIKTLYVGFSDKLSPIFYVTLDFTMITDIVGVMTAISLQLKGWTNSSATVHHIVVMISV